MQLMRKQTTIQCLNASRQLVPSYRSRRTTCNSTFTLPLFSYTSRQYSSFSSPLPTCHSKHILAPIIPTFKSFLISKTSFQRASYYSSVALEKSHPPSISTQEDATPHQTHQTLSLEKDHLSPYKKKVLLLMSGGVDSSMCAYILKTQGYDVTGLYMHNWNHQEETQDESESKSAPQQLWQKNISTNNDTLYLKESSQNQRTARIRPKVCTSDRDWADIQTICAKMGIPARRLDFSRQYWNQVFEVMLQEYDNGRTPNPDVACNREIKFGELIEWCHKNGGLGQDRFKKNADNDPSSVSGWDYLATGHYARVELDPLTGKAKLLRALDSNKDQTYYLSTLPEKVLRNVIFPLAQYDKPTVKKMAIESGLEELRNVAIKKESMGVCFVGQRKRFGEFLKEYLVPKPGPVKVDTLDGRLIGTHKGLFHYTVGQASGVTNGYQKWVVLKTDIPSNTLVVVEGTQNQLLFSPGLIAESWHWISGHAPKSLNQSTLTENGSTTEEFPFTAQIRHRQVPQPCRIEPILESSTDIESAKTFRVIFKEHQRAIAPGQQIVIYDKEECLGGAVIQSGLPSPFRIED